MKTFSIKIYRFSIWAICIFGQLPENSHDWTPSLEASQPRPKSPINDSKISLLQFNVENLFDTIHDEGKSDFTYMPLDLKRNPRFLDLEDGKNFLKSCVRARFPKWRLECLSFDWSEAILDQKISALASVIRSANDGVGADLVFLQEVENMRVLEKLVRATGSKDYIPVLMEGDDERGIDVALLSKFPVKRSILHFQKGSRGILQVSLDGPSQTSIEAFVLHLPAPYHSSSKRKTQLKRLNKLAKPYVGRSLLIAAGDFNVSQREESKEKILSRMSKQLSWNMAFKQGCSHCKGSHYYARSKEWSFLDQIWMIAPSTANWRFDRPSIQILNRIPDQNTTGPLQTPRRGEVSNGQFRGVSDHWPFYAELVNLP